jgi:hypothetical protein
MLTAAVCAALYSLVASVAPGVVTVDGGNISGVSAGGVTSQQ